MLLALFSPLARSAADTAAAAGGQGGRDVTNVDDVTHPHPHLVEAAMYGAYPRGQEQKQLGSLDVIEVTKTSSTPFIVSHENVADIRDSFGSCYPHKCW